MTIEYDQLAEVYERYRRCNAEVLRELVNGGKLTHASRVLEVGAGTGNYCRALRELAGCHCTAVEPSQAMRDLLRDADGEIDVVAGVGERLPLPSDNFDLVFCVGVVHHLSDPGAFLQEAFRVLEAAGVICVVTDSEDIIRARFPLAEYYPKRWTPSSRDTLPSNVSGRSRKQQDSTDGERAGSRARRFSRRWKRTRQSPSPRSISSPRRASRPASPACERICSAARS